MSSTVELSTPLAEIPKLAARERSALEKAGFVTAGDVLTHFPKRYEDRRQFDRFPSEASMTPVCIHGRVTDTSLRRFGRRKQFFEATLEEISDDAFSHPVVCRWFNMPWIHKIIAADQELVVFGKPKQSGKRLVIDHPEFEIVDPESEEASIHLRRITPVYRLGSGVSQRPLRTLLHRLLEELDPESVPDLLPAPPETGGAGEAAAEGSGNFRYAHLQQIHFPEDFDALKAARRYFAFEEFFSLQINVARRRREYLSRPGKAHSDGAVLLTQWFQQLPFELTDAQKHVIKEIRADLKSNRPMNRLLQGDVGSGKTAVALAAMLIVVEAGYQCALMAPTQILAEQHFLTLQRQLAGLDVRISLRTSAKQQDDFLELEGAPQIVVGTHALIHDNVAFQELGLVVIDEQHKFGVAQRGRLIEEGRVPDVLVMTATPIPRTLTMTVYGDLDVSILDELPPGRGTVITAVRPASKTVDAARFVRDHLAQGRQAYIVYPLIEDSETLKLKSATVEHERWVPRFPDHEVGLLHGRLRPDEKDAVMTRFRSGEIQVLVCTTVIEVGVDVPNANIMLIYNAERFGLAQLHQLRGRIGRGAHKSYCILMADMKKGSAEALAKLQVLEDTTDGFEIAEADLELRGPGDVLGTAQSGLPDLKLGDLVTDTALVKEARDLARRILEEDPELAAPEHEALRALSVKSREALVT